jgi:hypothetical protein
MVRLIGWVIVFPVLRGDKVDSELPAGKKPYCLRINLDVRQ